MNGGQTVILFAVLKDKIVIYLAVKNTQKKVFTDYKVPNFLLGDVFN